VQFWIFSNHTNISVYRRIFKWIFRILFSYLVDCNSWKLKSNSYLKCVTISENKVIKYLNHNIIFLRKRMKLWLNTNRLRECSINLHKSTPLKMISANYVEKHIRIYWKINLLIYPNYLVFGKPIISKIKVENGIQN